jgi:hypothetical protein
LVKKHHDYGLVIAPYFLTKSPQKVAEAVETFQLDIQAVARHAVQEAPNEMLRNLPSRQFRYIRYQSLEPNAVNVAEVIFFDIQNKCAKFAADFQHLRVLHLLEQDSEALDCLTLDIIGLIVKAP